MADTCLSATGPETAYTTSTVTRKIFHKRLFFLSLTVNSSRQSKRAMIRMGAIGRIILHHRKRTPAVIPVKRPSRTGLSVCSPFSSSRETKSRNPKRSVV